MEWLIKLIARQTWIRFGIRDRIVRKYCDPDTVSSTEFEAEFFGLKYKGNLNSFVDWSVYFYGAYEKEYLYFLRDLIKDSSGPVFIDVGANVGNHSMFMSQYCKEVYAFEPNPNVRKRLEEKIKINAKTNVHVHGFGLADKDADLQFFSPKGANQGTGSFVPEYSQNNEAGLVLKVVNADKYLFELGLSKIDLIKIDVEGFERNVLTGLRDVMQKYRPKLTVEYSATTMKSFASLEELAGLLPANYKIERIFSNATTWMIFNSPKCRLGHFDFKVPGGDLLMSPQ